MRDAAAQDVPSTHTPEGSELTASQAAQAQTITDASPLTTATSQSEMDANGHARATEPEQAEQAAEATEATQATATTPMTSVITPSAEPGTGNVVMERQRAAVEPYVLPLAQLQGIAEAVGLQWINSDAEKIAAAQATIAAQPKPVHVPRERKPVVVVDEGPLVLVETRKDLSQMKLPFETATSPKAP